MKGTVCRARKNDVHCCLRLPETACDQMAVADAPLQQWPVFVIDIIIPGRFAMTYHNKLFHRTVNCCLYILPGRLRPSVHAACLGGQTLHFPVQFVLQAVAYTIVQAVGPSLPKLYGNRPHQIPAPIIGPRNLLVLVRLF